MAKSVNKFIRLKKKKEKIIHLIRDFVQATFNTSEWLNGDITVCPAKNFCNRPCGFPCREFALFHSTNTALFSEFINQKNKFCVLLEDEEPVAVSPSINE